VAGAIAVALAAGLAWQARSSGRDPDGHEFLKLVHQHTPESHVRQGIENALKLGLDSPVESAVAKLGNGSAVTAPDTVPLALWCAAHHLNNYEEALWTTVSGRGDVDTTCAIVGGVVVMYTGIEGIPAQWFEYREQVPDWVLSFQNMQTQ
jgi:ADP-ribosylglycohydrolase